MNDALIEVEEKDSLSTKELIAKEQIDSIVVSCPVYLRLTDGQKAVLIATMNAFLTEDIPTDKELARIAGVHPNTVKNCKKNRRFVEAITEIMPEMVRAKLPKIMVNAVKLTEKSQSAIEFLARYSGVYVPKSQSVNVNTNIRLQAGSVSPDQAIDSFIDRLLMLGWSAERIYEKAKSRQSKDMIDITPD